MLKLFYRAKWLKYEKKNSPTPVYTALLSILLCMVCMAGTSWAWFTASKHVPVAPISVAEYGISISVDGEHSNSERTLGVGNHEIAITANGSASTGYCIVDLDDSRWYTTQIPAGHTLNFRFDVNQEAMLKISALWGVHSESDAERIISEGGTYTYGNAPATPPDSGVEIQNEAALIQALNDGETNISIAADFALTQNHNIQSQNIVIDGNGHSFILSGDTYKGTLFTVGEGASLSITDVTFDYDENSFEVYYDPSNPWSPKFTTTATATPVEAPAIVSNGNIVLNNVTIRDRYCNIDNSAAVQILYGTAEFNTCNFIHNLGKSGSAAVYVGGTMQEGQTTHSVERIVFNNCTFEKNIQTLENGNAVYIYSAQETYFKDCKFIGNAGMGTQSGEFIEGGGAIYIAKGSEEGVTIPIGYKLMNVHIDDCIFKDNISMNDGSAIENQGANLYIKNSTFENNAAKSVGTVSCISYTVAQGANPTRTYDCQIDSCTFTDNFATAGAVFGNHASAYDFKIISSTVSKGQGAEAFLLYEGNNLIKDCQFNDNSFTKATVNLTYGDDCDGNAIVNNCVFSGSSKPAIRLQAGKRGGHTLSETCTIQGTVTGNIVMVAPNGNVGTSTLVIEGVLNGNIDCYTDMPIEQIILKETATHNGSITGSPKITAENPITEPPVTEPPVTEPSVTEPSVTEPSVTEPSVTEPSVTEPPVTEPPVTTEPVATDPPETTAATEPPTTTEPVTTEPPATTEPATTSEEVTEPTEE